MGLFDLFKKKEAVVSVPRGFFTLRVKEKIQLTPDSVKITFSIPEEIKDKFTFIPGQYVNLAANIEGKTVRRSYSICSGTKEDLAVGIKKVTNGLFSSFAVDQLHVGDVIWVSEPMGNFQWKETATNIVAFAAGSGITPILSIAKTADEKGQNMTLFYGNKSVNSTMFYTDLKTLKTLNTSLFLTQEVQENCAAGRINKQVVLELIEQNNSLLTADNYFLCGPQEMIESIKDTLLEKGVSKEKIYFELFESQESKEETQPTSSTEKTAVTVICDREEFHFEMNKNTTVLHSALEKDVDAPYSCRGGVCCTCKAKVLEGSAEMKINFTLTDQEINQGYILTCQAHPTSDKLVVSYDE